MFAEGSFWWGQYVEVVESPGGDGDVMEKETIEVATRAEEWESCSGKL